MKDNSDVRRLHAIGLNQHGFEVSGQPSPAADTLDPRIQCFVKPVSVDDLVMHVEHPRGAGRPGGRLS